MPEASAEVLSVHNSITQAQSGPTVSHLMFSFDKSQVTDLLSDDMLFRRAKTRTDGVGLKT